MYLHVHEHVHVVLYPIYIYTIIVCTYVRTCGRVHIHTVIHVLYMFCTCSVHVAKHKLFANTAIKIVQSVLMTFVRATEHV